MYLANNTVVTLFKLYGLMIDYTLCKRQFKKSAIQKSQTPHR